MEEVLLAYAVIVAEKEEIVKRKRLLKHLRDSSDPFVIPDSIFIQYFRLPKEICRDLIAELLPHDVQKTTIPFGLRFLATLYFFAHGSYQKCVGNSFLAAMSQSTVSRSLHYIAALIVNTKSNEVCFPTTNDKQLAIKTGFHKQFGIERTVGVIDCTHIGIIAPKPMDVYTNRNGGCSINVEAVCDHELHFLAINANFPGSCTDSGIWSKSAVRKFMMRQSDCWLLGDEEYPLEPWLLTPISEPTDIQQEKYNKMHKTAHHVIEKAVVMLKKRFRCLSKNLYYSHERAVNIINACVILHNISLRKCPASHINVDEEAEFDKSTIPVKVCTNQYYHEALRIRDQYVKTL